MTTSHRVFANLYQDSVSLMQLAAKLKQREGVQEASCVMATPANLAQLADADLSIDVAPGPSDLIVVVRGDAGACEEALADADALLRAPAPASSGERDAYVAPLTSIAAAVERTPDADLALVSVPGDYAAAEARKAVALGLDVMLFSDNVTVEDERAVKEFADRNGRLVMGPDCGTAIVNGVPLGFANVVRRGPIGLVAASGTGLQEVTCRIHNLGGGVSQALGTGGRDLKEEIGGITMLAGLRALAGDAGTKVIVLISKPPAPAIARAILDLAASAGKPVVVHFLGESAQVTDARLHTARSLRHAADCAVALANGEAPPAFSDRVSPSLQDAISGDRRGAVRGLFTGGTFCYEAQLVFLARGRACSSNAPVAGAAAIAGEVTGHAFIDFGDDEYTRGRPHPMIDPSLRNAAIESHAADARTAVVLFDVVLGFGAHPDPAADLARVLRTARARKPGLTAIGHVCGTDGDPQNRNGQIAVLKDAGAIVADSNYEAAVLAARLAAS